MVAGLLARAEAELADLSDVDGTSAVVDGVRCASYAIPEPWATYARPVEAPADLRRVRGWLAGHAERWTVRVSADDAGAPAYRGMDVWARLPAYVWDGRGADAGEMPGLVVTQAREPGEVLVTYGDRLAPLVTERHLRAGRYRWLVGWLDGEPVACALLRRAAGTVYLSAVTVRPAWRGRGIGTAISAAATRQAGELGGGPVWLHAAGEESARIYRRLGYRRVDEHLLLAP